jgi:uncharacterized RDD family membrane protein YckC
MADQVIEPSEIITGRDEPIHHLPLANPWLRLIARFFDYSLFFTLLHFVSSPISLPVLGRFIPIEYFAWIPIEAIFLSTWGTTPGKWLLRSEVKKGHAKRLPFRSALRRSFSVWLYGIGMGIPIVIVLCMLNAYYRLRVLHTTSWDRQEGSIVIHHSIPKWRYYTVAAAVLVGMVYYSFWIKSWL